MSEQVAEKSTLKEFLLTTSAHGLHKVAASNARSISRAIWVAIILGAVALLIVQFEKLVGRLLSEPLTTEINRNVQDFVFPDVLLCLTNAVDEEKATNKSLPGFELTLKEVMQRSLPLWAAIGNLTTEKAAALTRRTLRGSAERNELITELNITCTYNQAPCGEQLAVFHHPKYWTCRSFRPKLRVSDFFVAPLKLSIKISPKRRLRAREERYWLSEGIPFMNRGVVVQIHPPGTYPDDRNNVLYVPLNVIAKVDISLVHRQKQNTQKQPCSVENKMEEGYKYTAFDICNIRAAKRAMFDRCKCCYRNVPGCSGMPQTPCFPPQPIEKLEKQANGSVPPSAVIARTLCAFNFTESYQGVSSSCKQPCSTYEYTLASFGRALVPPDDEKTMSPAEITFSAASGDKPLLVQESLAYTEVDLLSDIGGAMCLCLGCSIITLLEFFELPLLSAYTRCRKG